MASKSVNSVTLIGNLTRDPELKYTPSGTAVCSFGLATNRSWTTNEGETKEDVQFHRIVAWQKLAELCAQILTKGRKVYLEGRIAYRSYEGKDGIQRQTTEIVMDDFVVFDDRRKSDEESAATVVKQTQEPVADEMEASAPPTSINKVDDQPKESKTEIDIDDSISEEDIPF